MNRLFHICTISNKPQQYAGMRASFAAAGFDESRCAFTNLDNSSGNFHEPYSAFNRIKAEATEKYLIVCHQDVLLSQGHGFDDLVKALSELDQRFPRWAVAGNVGYNRNGDLVGRLTDPWPTPLWPGPMPEPICTLDENWLVINRAANVQWSRELSGFHFYGTDICLNAYQRGYECYVIDFRMEHLSKGNMEDPNFWKIKTQFEQHWQKHFGLALVVTTTTQRILLTRYAWLRPFCRSRLVVSRLHRPRPRKLADYFGLTPRPKLVKPTLS